MSSLFKIGHLCLSRSRSFLRAKYSNINTFCCEFRGFQIHMFLHTSAQLGKDTILIALFSHKSELNDFHFSLTNHNPFPQTKRHIIELFE